MLLDVLCIIVVVLSEFPSPGGLEWKLVVAVGCFLCQQAPLDHGEYAGTFESLEKPFVDVLACKGGVKREE